jgi:Fic family protein
MNVDVGDSVNFALSFEFISENMKNFIDDINYPRNMTIDDVAEFHCRFERIHPFLDGNGRIGRLIMLKQCIENNITPFIINNNTKDEYINSMKMYHQTGL